MQTYMSAVARNKHWEWRKTYFWGGGRKGRGGGITGLLVIGAAVAVRVNLHDPVQRGPTFPGTLSQKSTLGCRLAQLSRRTAVALSN